MPQDRPPDGSERQARRILSRVAQESDSSAMAAPAGDGEADWAEVWGTRIGRVLGPALLLACALWLLFHLTGGG